MSPKGKTYREYAEMKNNIKKFRLEKGLTQIELAMRSDTTQNTISAIETGLYSPTAYLAGLICIALDRKFEEVFHFEFKKEWEYIKNNKIVLNIWNRDFTLEIKYDCYSNENVTNKQLKAIKNFTEHPEWLRNAKTAAENYCKKFDGIIKKGSIFSYIKPDYMFVTREEYPRIAIMCNYKYDSEHGLAIIFTQEGKVAVGNQDIIL